MTIKVIIKSVIDRCGYRVCRSDRIGVNPWRDMQRLVPDAHVVFDVGANIGQTTERFLASFQNARIYAFEPCRASFLKLHLRYGNRATCENLALAGSVETLVLNESSDSTLNSFLPRVYDAETQVLRHTAVQTATVDRYCDDHRINHIDILKTDTEGFDLYVLMGASEMIAAGKISAVYIEANFCRKYDGQASFGQEYDWLIERGFRLVSLYDERRDDVKVWQRGRMHCF